MNTNKQFVQDFNSLSTYLRGFAMKLAKDQSMASDLFQETAFNAFRNQTKFRTGTNMKAWLSTIMKNSFINSYRKNKRRNEVQDTTEESYLLNRDVKSTENEGEMNLQMNELTMLIEKLNPLYRVPFLMAYQGYQYDEIQIALGNLPIGTVKSRIHHARKILKNQIKEMYSEVTV